MPPRLINTFLHPPCNHSTVKTMKRVWHVSVGFLAVLFACSALPALAQQESEAPGRTLITFEVTGQMKKARTDLPEFPLSVIQQLMQEQAMTRFNIESKSAMSSMHIVYPFTIEFAFRSMDAFVEWYASESTRQLLQEIRKETVVEFTLAVERLPQTFATEQ